MQLIQLLDQLKDDCSVSFIKDASYNIEYDRAALDIVMFNAMSGINGLSMHESIANELVNGCYNLSSLNKRIAGLNSAQDKGLDLESTLILTGFNNDPYLAGTLKVLFGIEDTKCQALKLIQRHMDSNSMQYNPEYARSKDASYNITRAIEEHFSVFGFDSTEEIKSMLSKERALVKIDKLDLYILFDTSNMTIREATGVQDLLIDGKYNEFRINSDYLYVWDGCTLGEIVGNMMYDSSDDVKWDILGTYVDALAIDDELTQKAIEYAKDHQDEIKETLDKMDEATEKLSQIAEKLASGTDDSVSEDEWRKIAKEVTEEINELRDAEKNKIKDALRSEMNDKSNK